MADTQIDEGLKSEYIRVTLTLPDKLDRVLQQLGNDAHATGGYKIPRTMIMRALARLLVSLDVGSSGVRTEGELIASYRSYSSVTPKFTLSGARATGRLGWSAPGKHYKGRPRK